MKKANPKNGKRSKAAQSPSKAVASPPKPFDKRPLVAFTCLLVFTAIAMPIMIMKGKQKKQAEATAKTAVIPNERRKTPEYAVFRPPSYARNHSLNQEAVLVWGGDHQYTDGLKKNTSVSNITREDYAGADACMECHDDNYEAWSQHGHRWMNVLANKESVKGDFSGGPNARIMYRDGLGEFYREGESYMMRLSRDDVVREFKIHRTLGYRIHQYYIGVLVKGPESADDPLRTLDHVLPFGYELTMKKWIPPVHARGHEGPDIARDDPFVTPSRLPYDKSCSLCHTTMPMGNQMLAMFKRFAAYSPRKIHFEGSNYIDAEHPGAVRLKVDKNIRLTKENIKEHVNSLSDQSHDLLKQENVVNLGISCEACHLGSKAHVENKKIMPPFYPAGHNVYTSGNSEREIWGKTAANKNFICARCHSGDRPLYAAGMATWNSTEYTDAMRGACYHPDKAKAHGMRSLTCVTCHNPHETIGRRWTKSAQSDRQSCVSCHTQFKDETVAQAHTHHPVGSSGSQCMNCHMPKINEGMGDLVRTHAIFKPTNVAMLEANQPNACNMCHIEKSIDWTLTTMQEWYGMRSLESGGVAPKAYSDAKIAAAYPNRSQSAALGWLQSKQSATRLVGSDVLLKAKATWALPELIDVLNDPYMEVRQFTVQRLIDYFYINPEDYGYQLYMLEDERHGPLEKMRAALLSKP